MPLDTSCPVSARRRPPGPKQAPNKTSKYLRLPPVEKMSRFTACIFSVVAGCTDPSSKDQSAEVFDLLACEGSS